ncbi:MAG: hypothetical protein IPF62_13775 [Bacteroidetes bacterium]|nr:hypothetical protein [Bacteroidota bacterium]
MTDKERIYKYLDSQIQHRTFRNWLLKHADLEMLFGKEDGQKLAELIIIYSDVKKIRNIIIKHIDLETLEKYSRYQLILRLKKFDIDILDTLDELEVFARRISDKSLEHYTFHLNNKFMNLPRELEKKNWHAEIYNLKRKQLEELQQEISIKLLELEERFYFSIDNEKGDTVIKRNSFIEKLKWIFNSH